MKMRLDRWLATLSLGSRSEVKEWIRNGTVRVNAMVVRDPGCACETEQDALTVLGEPVDGRVMRHVMMNKPAGYVCSSKGGLHPTVFDLLEESDRSRRLGGELGIVGRLDLDTEGLLILTTDGELNHRLTSPKHHVPKTYLVRLEAEVPEAVQKQYSEAVAAGVEIPPEDHEPGAVCRDGELEWDSADTCRLTIYEGLYHEVKRIFAVLGNRVRYLKRLSMNNLALDPSLEPGSYRRLTGQELSVLTLTNHIL